VRLYVVVHVYINVDNMNVHVNIHFRIFIYLCRAVTNNSAVMALLYGLIVLLPLRSVYPTNGGGGLNILLIHKQACAKQTNN
jgi:hypothetical protein